MLGQTLELPMKSDKKAAIHYKRLIVLDSSFLILDFYPFDSTNEPSHSETFSDHCVLMLNRRGFFMSRTGWVDCGHSLINKNVQGRSQCYKGFDSKVLIWSFSQAVHTTWVSLRRWAFCNTLKWVSVAEIKQIHLLWLLK